MYFNGNRFNGSNKINVPCRYYQQGTCRNGSKCRYLHTDNNNGNNAIGSRFENTNTNNQQSSAFGNPNFNKLQSQSSFGSNPFTAAPNSNPFGGNINPSNNNNAGAFGASGNTNASPFGAGSNTNASPFGAGGNTNASPFGAGSNTNASPFGAGSNTNASPFGSGGGSSANPFGGNTASSAFGSAPANRNDTPISNNSVFGNQQNANNSSAFNNTGSTINSAFGPGTQASPFGSDPNPNTQSPFGTNPMKNNAATSAFANTNAFAANPFSSTNQSSITTNHQPGMPNNTIQENNFTLNQQQSPFGGSSNVQQSSAFGQPAAQGSAFGFNNNNSTSIFGNNQQQSTSNNAGGFGFSSGAVGAQTSNGTSSDPLLQGPIPDEINEKTLLEIDSKIMSVPENVMNAFKESEFRRGDVPEIAPSFDLCF